MGGICRRSTAAHTFSVTRLSSIRIRYVDSYERDASVSRTICVVFTRVFDAHHYHTYTGYEYSA